MWGVRAPTQSHGQLQVEFIASVREELNRLVDGDPNLIVCGDFNIHLSELDTQNRFRLTRAASEWLALLRELNLVDVWRNYHKTKRQYTWRRFNPSQQSRIVGQPKFWRIFS